MEALYISDINKKEEEIENISGLIPDFDSKNLRIFTQNSGLTIFPYNPDYIGSIFYPPSGQIFARIFIGKSLRIFKNAWIEVLFKKLNNILTPEGTIFIPYFSNNEANSKGYWSLSALQDLFKQKGKLIKISPSSKGNYVEFQKTANLVVKGSVLDWYFQDYASLIIENIIFNNSLIQLGNNTIEDICSEMILSSKSSTFTSEYMDKKSLKVEISTLDKGLGTEKLIVNLQNILGAQAYSVGGINYKGTLMSYIISQYFTKNKKLSFIDHGGGYGLLAAELLMNKDLNIAKAVNCDINQNNLIVASRLFYYFIDLLRDRFFFSLGAAQDFKYDSKYDIISFIGSLLYVPREKTLITLQRAWEALNTGGILIVHENIQSPSYNIDYEIMFTVDELEKLLTQFGSIDYYLSTATVAITKNKVGSKSVFRVVRKMK